MKNLGAGLLTALVMGVLVKCSTKPTSWPTRTKANVEVFGLAEDSDLLDASLSLSKPDMTWDKGDPEVNWVRVPGIYSNSDAAPVDKFLRLARRSIDIEIYEMEDLDVREALRAALARGVRIRILREPSPVGEVCHALKGVLAPVARGRKPRPPAVVQDCQDQIRLISEIQAQGGAVEAFNKEELCGQKTREGRCFQHGKMILVDRRFALLSTGNFNATNLCNLKFKPEKCNRDFSYITRDEEVVSALSEIFERDLKGGRYDLESLLGRGQLARKLTVSPFSYEPLKNFIGSAQRSIQFQNQYIYPTSGLAELLIEKAKTGVKILVQLRDVCHFGRLDDEEALQLDLMYRAMESAGIQVRMFPATHRIQGRPGYMHAKAIVVDGGDPSARAWVGSVNGSWASLNQNREFGVFFSQPARVQALSDFMAKDFAAPTSQTWRDSLQCRKVGYASASATHANDERYSRSLQKFSQKAGKARKQAEDEEE